TLWSMQQLANSYESVGRHDEALKLREQTLAAKKRVLPPDHPDMLFSSQNLAASYEAVGRYSEALKLDEETLAACKRVFAADHPVTLACMWGIADCLVKLDRGTEAVPIIDECLALAAGKPVNPRMIPEMMDLRLRHFQKASDPAGCRTTAAMWEKLDRHDAASLYNAACFRAVTAAVQAKAGGADAQRLAREDADKAMQWLTGAAGAGWHDPAQMEKDADLDPLRERADFRKLLAALDTEVNENVAATRQSFRREPDKPSEGTTQPTAVSSPDARASPP
ncbi:MAG TPA: tetratricopeptide repeat protein, partial [Tepidisphaeraceae bacterium]